MRKTVTVALLAVVLATVIALAAAGCGSGTGASGKKGGGEDPSYIVASCRANQRTLQGACQVHYAENEE